MKPPETFPFMYTLVIFHVAVQLFKIGLHLKKIPEKMSEIFLNVWTQITGKVLKRMIFIQTWPLKNDSHLKTAGNDR